MKLRAVEQLAEDQRDLLLEDAGAVVLDADFEAVGAGLLDVDPNLGQDAGLFAGVERVVDRFLDRGEQRLARIVEAQQVAVLGEELADRDVALRGGHALGRGATAPAGRDDASTHPPRLLRRSWRGARRHWCSARRKRAAARLELLLRGALPSWSPSSYA